MSAPTRPLRSALRSPEWIIVAVHAGVVAAPVVFAGTGSPDVTWPGLLITVPLGAVLLAAEVPISLAVARGKQPSHAWWRLLAVAAAVCVPSLWFGPNWLTTDIFLTTAGVTLLRRHAALIIAAWILWRVAFTIVLLQGFPGGFVAYSVFYAVGWSLSLIGALVGSTWLVRTLGELHATRSELARLAVERERVRLARDLHDLLGQSLSAVSLKGDLALRLLRSDTTAARDEINPNWSPPRSRQAAPH